MSLDELGMCEKALDQFVDMVNHPPHYTKGKIEVIDFLEDQDLPFHLAHAVRYICRCRYKGDLETDLNKAIWYLERYIHVTRNNSGDPTAR